MSTQAIPPSLMSVDSFLPEMSAPLSMEIGNASNRRWKLVYDSVEFAWDRGEVRAIEEILGPKVDEWGVPGRLPTSLVEVGRHGEKVVPRRVLHAKLGGSLSEILTKLFSVAGCPLYPVKHDGQDEARRRIAQDRFRAFRVPEAQATIEDHRARCQRDYNAGLPPTPKPSNVREAEQDVELFSRTLRIGEGRYVVRKDGDSFDYLEDAQAHIVKHWPELVDSWRSQVMDRVGGPNTVKPTSAHESVQTENTGFAQGHVPSPAALGILALAEQSGKTLDPELVERLDRDPAAVIEAMTFIMTTEKKGKGKS